MAEKNNNENVLKLLAIPELTNKNFFIPDYQRGYRWGQLQVTQLMDDLTEFFSPNGKGNFYCLQPVVVKELSDEEKQTYHLLSDTDDNHWYEVIDGQQRLTTIRVIFLLRHLMIPFNNDKFQIYYQTRPELSKVFDKFIYNPLQDPYDVSIADEEKLDIDSWHVYHAVRTIMAWIKGRENGINEFNGTFYQFFTNPKGKDKSVQVIWYELRDGSDANETFKRINDKKVPLNNAELIRSMFLSESADFEIAQDLIKGYPDSLQKTVEERELARMQSHIIEMWDVIEKALRQQKFWSFITQDGNTDEYSSRIEYLFDLISKKKEDEKDALYTFLTFNEMVREKKVKGLWELWQKVESYFSMLQAWYTDRDYYHEIGFLIYERGKQILIDLLEKASKENKSVFKKRLNWELKKEICGNDEPERIFEYNYADNSAQLLKVITLYNVEAVRQNTSMDFFPFDLFKNTHWTLEHIHAQNSQGIDQSDRKKWALWIKENIQMLKNIQHFFEEDDKKGEIMQIISNLEAASTKVVNKNFTFSEFTRYYNSVTAFFNGISEEQNGIQEIHNISNMALLGGVENTEIGNSVFEAKRQKILEMDADGKYIPYCTRRVFLKYFEGEGKDLSLYQTFYWGENDRDCYLKDIKSVLKTVLDTTDPNIVENNTSTENV